MMKQVSYEEIAKCKVEEGLNLVFSKCGRGGYTIAQQMVDGKRSSFLKGAIHVDKVESLVNIRDVLNVVIEQINKEEKGE